MAIVEETRKSVSTQGLWKSLILQFGNKLQAYNELLTHFINIPLRLRIQVAEGKLFLMVFLSALKYLSRHISCFTLVGFFIKLKLKVIVSRSLSAVLKDDDH